MYLDKEAMFSEAQTVAAGPSDNVMDVSVARDLGTGENLYIGVVAKEDLVGTLVVTLEVSDDEAFTTPVVAQTIGTFEAAAVAGSRLFARLQPIAVDKQFVRLAYAGGTGGVVDAFLTHNIDATKAYKSGYNVTVS